MWLEYRISAVVLIPLTWGTGYGFTLGWVLTRSGWAISGVAISSALAYMMYFHVIRKSGPVFASQCGYVVTISGVAVGDTALFGIPYILDLVVGGYHAVGIGPGYAC